MNRYECHNHKYSIPFPLIYASKPELDPLFSPIIWYARIKPNKPDAAV